MYIHTRTLTCTHTNKLTAMYTRFSHFLSYGYRADSPTEITSSSRTHDYDLQNTHVRQRVHRAVARHTLAPGFLQVRATNHGGAYDLIQLRGRSQLSDVGEREAGGYNRSIGGDDRKSQYFFPRTSRILTSLCGGKTGCTIHSIEVCHRDRYFLSPPIILFRHISCFAAGLYAA